MCCAHEAVATQCSHELVPAVGGTLSLGALGGQQQGQGEEDEVGQG